MSTVSHTTAFEIDQPAATLFPLFSAEGEKLWVPGWDYTDVMGYPEMHEDYVFLTDSHDHAAGQAVWLVKRHDPEAWRVELYKVEPGDKVGLVKVGLSELAPSRTRVEVTYTYTGLSASGDEFVRGFTAEAYAAFIGEWKELLEAYFAGGGRDA